MYIYMYICMYIQIMCEKFMCICLEWYIHIDMVTTSNISMRAKSAFLILTCWYVYTYKIYVCTYTYMHIETEYVYIYNIYIRIYVYFNR